MVGSVLDWETEIQCYHEECMTTTWEKVIMTANLFWEDSCTTIIVERAIQ
jgi:hypothetical protein